MSHRDTASDDTHTTSLLAAAADIAAPMGYATVAPTPRPTTNAFTLQDQHNSCTNKEELFGGLCYKKCSLLTGGKDPIRTSPWTCCKSHPCSFNQKGSLGSHVACAGYDISGDGICPHEPGHCLADEEMLLGICYKKCSLLTKQDFPHRVGPATCCKDSGLHCLDFRKDYTSEEFDVGGSGSQDDDSACGPEGELWLGMCYKKCSILTGNTHPHRIAAATCCRVSSRFLHKSTDGTWHLGCLDFRQDETRLEFNAPLGLAVEQASRPPPEPHSPTAGRSVAV